MADVAFAAGFSSIRQFNDTVREVFALTPTALRERARAGAARRTAAITLRLAHRLPLCPDNLFGHLAATAVPGVEEVQGATYRRTLRLAHGPGIAELTPAAGSRGVPADAHRPARPDHRDRALPAAARPRRRPRGDRRAARRGSGAAGRSCAARPGRRVPRCTDGAELALRAVLGQQVSTAAARTHAGRLAERFGEPVTDARGGLTRLFPAPGALAGDPARDAREPAAHVRGAGRGARVASGCRSTRAATATRRSRSSPASRASARGRPRSSRCAHSATPTRSCPATSACGARREALGCRRRPPRSPRAPSRGGPGAPMPSSTCGPRATTRSTTGRPSLRRDLLAVGLREQRELGGVQRRRACSMNSRM